MATTTQNLGLIKPAGTDKIRIAQINSNMDTIDAKMGPVGSTPLQTQVTNAATSISALQSGMAIVCNGNTHAAIASGQYAYVRSHNSLAEGLYQATAAIATNATLSTSNLTAVSGGGLNSLNSKIEAQTGTATAADSSVTINAQSIKKSANVVCASFQATSTNAITSNAWTDFVVLPVGYRPSANLFAIGIDNTHDLPCSIQIKTNGTVSVYGASANSGMKSLKVGVSFI